MKQRYIKGANLFPPRIYHPSFINRKTLQCDSSLERDFLIGCEFDPSIKRFMTQPNSFHYRYEGRKRRYTSDVRIEFKDGRFLDVEVKDVEQTKGIKGEKLKKKIALISELLQTYQNSSLALITSDDIALKPGYEIRKTLYRFLFVQVERSLMKKGRELLAHSDLVVSKLENCFEQWGADRSHAWAFIAQNYSSINFCDEPAITTNTLLKWS